ncbi:MAG TPA: pyrroline-5-carboxylate reductase [Thermodesulfovibrionia bacterium]|nr:pyrroline-5-carboxylate reductase [Thermodesulfovibrionia bacterium]
MIRESAVLGFIGGGNMAEAMIHGFFEKYPIFVSDPVAARLNHLAGAYNVSKCVSNREVVEKSDIVILAVKPQHVEGALTEIAPFVDKSKLLISIAAGISLSRMRAVTGAEARLIRVMPNTPALVAEGMTVVVSDQCLEGDLAFTETLFASIGRVISLEEKHIDAVTALSGSGPAYVFLFIEAMADGGVKMGLPRTVALQLAAQTVLGAAKMVISTSEHPACLKDRVTSPGGTTIEGLHILEQAGVRGALMLAVEAAALKSATLGK